jgi:hypothetical protein
MEIRLNRNKNMYTVKTSYVGNKIMYRRTDGMIWFGWY